MSNSEETPKQETEEVKENLQIPIPKEQEKEPEIPPEDGFPPEGLWLTSQENFVDFTIYAYKDRSNKLLQAITALKSSLAAMPTIEEYPVWSSWTIPTKPELSGYRKQATQIFRGVRLVDDDEVARELIRNHLKELKIQMIVDGELVDIGLVRDGKGRLTTQSMELLDSLHPTFQEVLIGQYTLKACISLV